MPGYTVVTNPSFFPAEVFTDDEVVEYELDGFHFLSDLESRKLQCCDWLIGAGEGEDDELDELDELEELEEPDELDEEEDYDFFYRPDWEREVDEEDLREYHKRQADAWDPDAGFSEFESAPKSSSSEPEVEEVWKAQWQKVSYNCANLNRRGRETMVRDRETWKIVDSYHIPGQRCHGGNDTRRFRRDDTSGKLLGNSHRRPSNSTIRQMCLVAVNVSNGDNRVRRFRVSR